MQKAFEKVKEFGEHDPEYDSVADPDPTFGNHSNRRYADQVALQWAAKNDVDATMIDFFFGWNLKKMKEEMRLHYAGLNRSMRLRLSRVTMNV